MTDKATHTPLPCHICGDEPLVRYRGGAWGVNCAGYKPSHMVWAYGDTEAEAITAWNTRAVNSHHDLIEALREAASALGIVEAQRKGGLNPILKRAKDNADAALKAVDHG